MWQEILHDLEKDIKEHCNGNYDIWLHDANMLESTAYCSLCGSDYMIHTDFASHQLMCGTCGNHDLYIYDDKSNLILYIEETND